jgi:hypothetical protein
LKILSFRGTSEMIHQMAGDLWKAYENTPQEWNGAFADRIVASAVLEILPRDPEHLNGTFSFCRATGLNQARMRLSIAHGCYQSLDAFARTPARAAHHQAIAACARENRIARIEPLKPREPATHGQCPYFRVNGERIGCPFAANQNEDVRAIYQACVDDPAHRAG